MEFKLNRKTYKLKTFFEEITLSDAEKISKIDVTDDDLQKIIEDSVPKDRYVIEVLSILSDAPKEELENLDQYSIATLFDCVRHFIKALFFMNFEKYEAIGVQSIRFKGKVYTMPESMMVEDELILCHKEPSINVIEVNNLLTLLTEMKMRGVEALRYAAAIYLRPKGDDRSYDEEVINERAEHFKELPFSIGLEVFFSLYFYFSSYLISTNACLEPQRGKMLHSMYGFIQLLKRGLQVRLKMLKNFLFGRFVKS